MLGAGEVWEQRSSFRAQRVFPGEATLQNTLQKILHLLKSFYCDLKL